MTAATVQRLVVGISGASGIVYGLRVLEALERLGVETHLIMSRTAEVTLAHETGLKVADVRRLASVVHDAADLAAAPSSGSFRHDGMIVAPCSVKTLAEIATGLTTTLLGRAADVTLKERRRLVLLVRETPLTTVHLRNMLTVTEMGAVVAPPVPAFYAKPATLDDMVNHTVGRALDLFGLDAGLAKRWGETKRRKRVSE